MYGSFLDGGWKMQRDYDVKIFVSYDSEDFS